MSGGSMNYLFDKVKDADFRLTTPERIAFQAHLALVAEALHDIEWVDSCDYGKGDETEAILKCISREAVDAEAAKAAAEALGVVVERYQAQKGGV